MPDFILTRPAGDTHDRMVCQTCGHIAYDNPKIVVGSVVTHGGAVLLCRRAINPRSGYWTLPAGYLEIGETPQEGALREAREEALAEIALDGLLAVYSISRIGQVQLIFRASFARTGGADLHAPGEESLETRLFGWDDIPWDLLAFPSVSWALEAWRAVGSAPIGAPSTNPASDRRGTSAIEGSAVMQATGASI